MASAAEVTVRIRNIAVGGDGVGEVIAQDFGSDLLGITAFVPFTAISEVVRARVVEKKERYLRTELIAVDAPSPERVTPACKYFTNCGGCELQHISYPAQLKAKEEMVRGSLRAGKLPTKVFDLLKPVVPGKPYGYRRRITLHVDANGRAGFYRQRSRSVVAIESCPISSAAVNKLLPNIQELGRELPGKVSSILLEEDLQGVVAVLKSPYDLSQIEAKEIIDKAKKLLPDFCLIAGGREAGGIGRQILDLPLNEKATFVLRIPAGHFSQINWKINLALIERVIQAANIKYGDTVYDLFAGAGNFTLPLARAGAQVTAVEVDRRLVSFGRENAKRHNLAKKVNYSELSVEKFLEQGKQPQIKTVVADPPRSGLGNLVSSLGFADNLLLISCHLPSFVRDLKGLTDRNWIVESIEPFDMFSQTSYLETLAILRRS